MKPKLWTKNFTLVTAATVLGAAGGIAGGFALSFLVYDETGSTLAAALLLAINVVPGFVIPLAAAPFMDRLPRKPILVWGDIVNGILYLLAGIYLLCSSFSYIGYLLFSLLLSTLSSFDGLAYNSIYPMLIPKGCEEKGYTVSGMIYPVLQVVMSPVAALLFSAIGVGNILLLQGGLSLLAAFIESRIDVQETHEEQPRFSFAQWKGDLKEAAAYLKQEKGLQSIYTYMAVTNGVGNGLSPLLVAFFRTAPGLSMTLYSFFTAAEFIGRSLGGILHYHVPIAPKRRFGFAFLVYQLYEAMDAVLLWLPYPLMLVNRGICGFLGINSASMRQAAVQRYLPPAYRARINAFETVLYSAACSFFALCIGALGEVLDLRICLTLCGAAASAVCWATIWRRRRQVRALYEAVD